jgi:hypothetical protein
MFNMTFHFFSALTTWISFSIVLTPNKTRPLKVTMERRVVRVSPQIIHDKVTENLQLRHQLAERELEWLATVEEWKAKREEVKKRDR